MKVEFKSKLDESGILVLCLTESGCKNYNLEKSLADWLSNALSHHDFKGKANSAVLLSAPHTYEQILVVGAGKAKTSQDLVEIGANIAARINCFESKAQVYLDVKLHKIDGAAAHIALGYKLKAYKFNKYKTDATTKTLKELTIQTEQNVKNLFKELDNLADGVLLARDLVNEPANVIYPESFVKIAKKIDGLEVEALDKKAMEKLGMNSLLGVAQGSAMDPYLLVLKYNGADKKKKPIAFVGKGVTFDSGGLSLKPSSSMETMKGDMAGSAVLLALMQTVAKNKLPINAVAVLGLVENMPSHKAQRPGDVVKAMSGTTIEILNTDSEGRLVLADALWYTQETFNPEILIDLATLTGAVVVALGSEYAAILGNDDKLAETLSKAGENTGERVWRLPMGEGYKKEIKSDIADIKNVGSGRGAGTITAAEFLKTFVKEDMPWMHIDIAGVELDSKAGTVYEKGATGFGVRLLYEFLKNHGM